MTRKLTNDEVTAFMQALARTVAIEKRSMCGDARLVVCFVVAQINDDGKLTDMKTLSNVDAASLQQVLKMASDKEVDADMLIVKATPDD